MTARLLIFTLCFGLSGPLACAISPLNGAPPLPATTSNVSFAGYAPAPSSPITIEASSTGTGGWTAIATALTSAQPTNFGDDVQLYYFTVRVPIPADRWAPDGCTTSQTFIRMRYAQRFFIPTFDHEQVSGVHPLDCVQDEQDGGATFMQALSACASADSPVARVRAADNHGTGTYVGNMTIDDPSDLQTYACVEQVQGSLTVAGPWTLDVEMPLVQSVTGNLSIEYPRQPNQTTPIVRAPQLPALTSVGADLTLNSPHPGGGGQLVNIAYGMNALTSVGGDLGISVQSFNTSASGLGGLTQVDGDLSVVTGTGDTDGYLNALQNVDGNVFLDLGHTVAGVLGALQTVGGGFTLQDGNPVPGVLDALTSVGGDFTLGTISFNGPPSQLFFPQLGAVAGRIVLSNTSLSQANFGGTSLQATGLTVDSNGGLTGLGPANFQISGSGSIEFTNNSNLCLSTINGFLAGQPSWTGAAVLFGNDDGC